MVHLVLPPKKAGGVALGSLVALLLAAGCGTPDAAPKPSPSIPTISAVTTSAQVSSTPVPTNNAITVRPTADPTTEEETPVEVTSEAPPPAPPPEPEPPAPPPPPTEETTDPADPPFVLQGTPCPQVGAIAVNRRLKPMVCTAADGDKPRWQPL